MLYSPKGSAQALSRWVRLIYHFNYCCHRWMKIKVSSLYWSSPKNFRPKALSPQRKFFSTSDGVLLICSYLLLSLLKEIRASNLSLGIRTFESGKILLCAGTWMDGDKKFPFNLHGFQKCSQARYVFFKNALKTCQRVFMGFKIWFEGGSTWFWKIP